MRSVLIVDDEIPSRELLKLSMDWRAIGFDEILEARNGRDALALYDQHRPALIITDIQMPVMDGLEFIRAVRERDAAQKIIILSCHESFSYAKEAMRLGVSDYILKDSFTGEMLMSTVLSTLSSRSSTKLSEPPRLDDATLRMALSSNGTPGAAEKLLATALGHRYDFFVCVARFEAGVLSSSFYLGLSGELSQTLANDDGGQVCATQDSAYMLVYTAKSPSISTQLKHRGERVSQLRAVLEKRFGLFVTIGVSRVHSAANRLSDALSEAREALSSAIFMGRGRDLYYAEGSVNDSQVELAVLDACVTGIEKALESGDDAALTNEIHRLYQRELRGMMQLNYLEHVNTLLMGVLIQSCTRSGIPFSQVFNSEMLSMEALDQYDSIKDICDWHVERFLLLSSARKAQHSPRIQHIIAHLNEHYRDDIGLDSVAATFRMHKVYLAKVFKIETGLSVNEYIRNLRVEEAKRMLERDGVRVSEVVSLLGFNNPQTFYQLFKRQTGMSPGDYKQRMEMRRVQKSFHEESPK